MKSDKIADRIRLLRERLDMTQAGLAKKLGITRASVNAWELGVSIPSTQYLIELSILFNVSTDYLLSMPKHNTINVDGLEEKEITMISELIEHLRNLHE